MKKENKYISFFLILIIMIICVILILILDGKDVSNKDTSLNENSRFISNNENNLDFSFIDIDNAEEAEYTKYVSKEAQEKLLNQKIKVQIKSISKINEVDKSTAIENKTEYTFLLTDYDNNNWITISDRDFQDNSWNIKIKNDLLIYGKYIGMTTLNNQLYPTIDISYIYKNLDKIDINYYTNIADIFINNLNELYTKENFKFKEMKSDTGYNTTIYTNNNDTLEIELIIDNDKIAMVDLYINTLESDINKIDQEFLKAFLMSFNTKITETNYIDLLNSAKNKKEEFEKNAFDDDYTFTSYQYDNIVIDLGITDSSITLYYSN